MRYFRADYEFHTRPRYHKGRLRTDTFTFAIADSQTDLEALRIANEEGRRRYPRHRWKITRCEELTPTSATLGSVEEPRAAARPAIEVPAGEVFKGGSL